MRGITVIDYTALEDWAARAAQTLQDICDEAQAATGNPDGETELRDVRALIDELGLIMWAPADEIEQDTGESQ